MKSLLALGVVAVVIGSARRADACTDTGLGDKDNAYVAPGSATSVPANVGRLFFHSARNCPPPAVSSLVLTDAAGSNVAFTTETAGAWDAVVIPAAPLAVGNYKLAYRDRLDILGCSADGVARESNFSVVAAVPAPTALGTITPITGRFEEHGDSGCAGKYVIRTATLQVEPSASLSPYASVVAYEVSVDGTVVMTTPYGTPGIRLAALCSGSTTLGPGGAMVEPGIRSISVLAKIAGGQVPSPAATTLTVDFSCTPPGSDAGPDGSTTDAEVPSMPMDASPVDTSSLDPSAETADASCSVAMLGVGGGASTLGAVMLAAAALLRRRRR